MKTKLTWLVFVLCSIFIWSGCSKDDDYTPNADVVNSFKNKYPDAKKISWKTKAGYHVVDFIDGTYEAEAWYDDSGNWIATETELPFNALPNAVKESFGFSRYNTWHVDETSRLEKEDAPEPLYIIEVENNDTEVALHYAKEGTLIREVIGKDKEEFQPVTIPSDIRKYITDNYPGATILDYESESSGFEVDILHNYMYIEVLFDASNRWVSSSWVTTLGLLPEVVSSAFNSSEYAGYEIDEIRQVEKPTGTFYEFELELNDNDITVTFDSAGGIVK